MASAHAQGFDLDGLRLGMTEEQLGHQMAYGPWTLQRNYSEGADRAYELRYSGTLLPSIRRAVVLLDSDRVQYIELDPWLPTDTNLSLEEEWRQTIESARILASAVRRLHPQASGPVAIDEISLEAKLKSDSGCFTAAVWKLGQEQIVVRLCAWMINERRMRRSSDIRLYAAPQQGDSVKAH